MKRKALTFVKTLATSKVFFTALILCLWAVASHATTYVPTTGAAEKAEELDGVWNKFAAFASGTGGKLAAAGIIVTSVWQRQVIGTIGMGVGIIIGIILPSIPRIIDTTTFCI